MSALERIGALAIIALLAATVVHWQTHPARRDQIQPQSTGYRIDINQADIATLSLLSGISSKLGEFIVEHRQAHGPFRSLEDLDAIRFIGPVTMRKIEPYITFDSAWHE